MTSLYSVFIINFSNITYVYLMKYSFSWAHNSKQIIAYLYVSRYHKASVCHVFAQHIFYGWNGEITSVTFLCFWTTFLWYRHQKPGANAVCGRELTPASMCGDAEKEQKHHFILYSPSLHLLKEPNHPFFPTISLCVALFVAVPRNQETLGSHPRSPEVFLSCCCELKLKLKRKTKKQIVSLRRLSVKTLETI